ncbi:MAG TPA: hypothetical protein VF656_08550 [Pyrinomonadaceae bacterium]|jgi:hypothetical protein
MAEQNTSGQGTIVKAIAWPLVVIIALVLFRTQIGDSIPFMTKVKIGSLSIEKESPLGKQASPEVLNALKGLSEESLFALMSRNLSVTCFEPPVNAAQTRNEHAQLINNKLLEEISATELKSVCPSYVKNPDIGLRLTPLGAEARKFQFNLLTQLSKS